MYNDLQISNQNCERIARTSGSNFYRSFSLLRPAKRQAMTALYAYARIIDDLGDARTESNNQAATFDSVALHTWVDRLPNVPNESRTNPTEQLSGIRLAVSDAVQKFQIPLQRLHEMIEGVELDQVEHVRIPDVAALDQYCYLVASSVGLACLSIWNGDTTKLGKAAIDCGIAFQLTNILRDVAEDSRQDRIYFPLDLMEAHKVDPSTWLQGTPNGDWIGLLRSQIARAKTLYLSGWKICQSLDTDGQRMFSLMWHTYHRLLLKIESEIESVWTHRTRLFRYEKIQLYMQHAITPSYLRFNEDVVPQEDESR
jgi:phytoene synthase